MTDIQEKGNEDLGYHTYVLHVRTGACENCGTDHVAEIWFVNNIGAELARVIIDGTLPMYPPNPTPTNLDKGTTYTKEFSGPPGVADCIYNYVKLTPRGGGGGSWRCDQVDVYCRQTGSQAILLPPINPLGEDGWLEPGGSLLEYRRV